MIAVDWLVGRDEGMEQRKLLTCAAESGNADRLPVVVVSKVPCGSPSGRLR